LRTVLSGSMPFVGLMLAGMVILAFVPQIALWLPGVLR
jgi:TRAP-type C4-dicarboxylate transport system permease large subunit